MLQHSKCANNFDFLGTFLATGAGEDLALDMEKFEAFLALHYARGLYRNTHPIKFLWNKLYGPKIFGETMPRHTFEQVQKHFATALT